MALSGLLERSSTGPLESVTDSGMNASTSSDDYTHHARRIGCAVSDYPDRIEAASMGALRNEAWRDLAVSCAGIAFSHRKSHIFSSTQPVFLVGRDKPWDFVVDYAETSLGSEVGLALQFTRIRVRYHGMSRVRFKLSHPTWSVAKQFGRCNRVAFADHRYPATLESWYSEPRYVVHALLSSEACSALAFECIGTRYDSGWYSVWSPWFPIAGSWAHSSGKGWGVLECEVVDAASGIQELRFVYEGDIEDSYLLMRAKQLVVNVATKLVSLDLAAPFDENACEECWQEAS